MNQQNHIGNIPAPRLLCLNFDPAASCCMELKVFNGMQAAATWLVDADEEAASVETREAAWREVEAAAEEARVECEAELRAVRQQLCDRCVTMSSNLCVHSSD